MQLPWVNAPQNTTPGQLGSIGDSLVGAARAKQENSRYAAETLRQQRADDERAQLHAAQIANMQSEAAARAAQAEEAAKLRKAAALKDVQSSIDAGRVDEARLKAKAYGLDAQQNAVPEAQQPGNTLMPMSPERPGAPTDEAVQQDAASWAATIAANPEMNEPELPAANSPGLVKDLYQSRSAGRFEPQAPAKPKGATWNLAGESYDPAQTEAANDAQREKLAARVEGAYGKLDFGPQAGALVRGNTGKEPEVDQAYIATQKAKEAEAQREQLLGIRNAFTEKRDERNNLTVAQKLSEAAKNRAARIQAAQASGGNARGDTSDRGAFDHVDRVAHQAFVESGMPKLAQTMQQLDIAEEDLHKPSGAAQVGARTAIERALRGGPPTQYMDEQERIHIGGFQAKIEGALQTFATGEFGEKQIKAIEQEIAAARESYQKFLDTRLNAIGKRLASDPSLVNMKGTVNARWKQLSGQFGRDTADLYPEGENALPPIGARSAAANAPKPTVGDKLKGAGKKKGGESAEERKKRLLMELSGG